MENTTNNTVITIETTVNAPVEKAWTYWNEPAHINLWCAASNEWHAPRATNELTPGGKLNTRMEAKDGSMGFNFEGTYTEVKQHEFIAYVLGDNRKVAVQFLPSGDTTRIVETFEAESMNPVEMQKAGWQAILDNFKAYTEGN